MKDLRLLEPISYYKELSGKLKENTEEYFSSLVEKSGIDIKKNEKTVKEYERLLKEIEKTKKKKKNSVALFILFSLLLGGTVFFSLLPIYTLVDYFQGSSVDIKITIFELALAIVLMVVLIILIVKFYKRKKNFESILEKLNDEKDKTKKRGEEEMSSLELLISSEDALSLVEKTLPSISFSRASVSKYIEYLKETFKDKDGSFTLLNLFDEPNIGINSVLSGTIDGKVFLFFTFIDYEEGTKEYTGFRSFPYTVYSTDSDGNSHSTTFFETLYAKIEKFYPYFFVKHSANYFSKACNNLTFTRKSTKYATLDKNKLNKTISKMEKERAKEEKKALKEGRSFTPMLDSEFELLFNTKDRDNDTEFRMLYTPLSIKNFKDIVLSPLSFGDNFSLSKKGYRTRVFLNESSIPSFRFRPDLSNKNFSFEKIKNNYLSNILSFFKTIYFGLAPMFSVPIYSESEDATIKDDEKYEINVYDAESLSTYSSYIRPVGSSTYVINKATFLDNIGDGAIFMINSSSFSSCILTEFVYVVGLHTSGNVPVEYEEFTPVFNSKCMVTFYIGKPDNAVYNETRKLFENTNVKDIVYKDGLLGLIFDNLDDIDYSKTEEIIRKLKENLNV